MLVAERPWGAGLRAADTLLIRAEDNLLPHIVAEVTGGVLELRTASGIDIEPTLPIEFELGAASLVSVALSGVGSIVVHDLVTPQLAVRRPGLGSIELRDLEADELDVVMQGIGEVRASGSVDRQTVGVEGIGSYVADALQSRVADVTVGGFGTATVRVSELLTATVHDGAVFYIGEPTVESTITGGGSVEPFAE